MKKIVSYIANFIAIVMGISAFVLGFMAYFVKSINNTSGIFYDGFGRQLYEAPTLLQIILPIEPMWAGFVWFILDLIVFFGLLVSAYYLFGVMDENHDEK